MFSLLHLGNAILIVDVTSTIDLTVGLNVWCDNMVPVLSMQGALEKTGSSKVKSTLYTHLIVCGESMVVEVKRYFVDGEYRSGIPRGSLVIFIREERLDLQSERRSVASFMLCLR